MVNGCHIEYNMNDLILNTAVTAPEGVITATLTAPTSQGGYTYKPFEKLFPIKRNNIIILTLRDLTFGRYRVARLWRQDELLAQLS